MKYDFFALLKVVHAATVYRLDGKLYNLLVSNFLTMLCAKSHRTKVIDIRCF